MIVAGDITTLITPTVHTGTANGGASEP